MNHREKYDLLLAVQEHLAKIGAEEWLKRRLASKILRDFPADPIGTINTFTAKGWQPSDIFHWLTNSLTFRKRNPHWADSYFHIFFVEELLQKAGLSYKTAHSLVITQAWIFSIPPVTLELSVSTLVNLGYEEDVIKSIANRMPHIFHLLSEHIVEECERANNERSGLLWNTKQQSSPSQGPPPIIEPESTSDTSHNEMAGAVIPADQEKAMESDGNPAEPEVPKPVKSVIPPKPNKKSLPPLKLFNPVLNPVSPKPVQVPPDPDDEVDPIEEKLFYRPATLDDDHNHNPAILDLKKIRSMVLASNSDADDDVWDKYYAENDWLAHVDSCEYQTCLLINHWVPLNAEVTPIQLAYQTEFGARARFWQAVLLDEKITPVLKVKRDVLELRMYVLRRLVREFLTEPEWLLREWELLDDVELRYRVNEIEARGKKPRLKPYITMLLEPNRGRFMKRLTKYIENRRSWLPSYLPDIDLPKKSKKKTKLPGKKMSAVELIAKLSADREKQK